MQILVLKTGALGDVLRTTSILPGLCARYPDARVTWVSAPAAVDLVRHHRLVERVLSVDPDTGCCDSSLHDGTRKATATRLASGRKGEVARVFCMAGVSVWKRRS